MVPCQEQSARHHHLSRPKFLVPDSFGKYRRPRIGCCKARSRASTGSFPCILPAFGSQPDKESPRWTDRTYGGIPSHVPCRPPTVLGRLPPGTIATLKVLKHFSQGTMLSGPNASFLLHSPVAAFSTYDLNTAFLMALNLWGPHSDRSAYGVPRI